jgi:hypothetical protein
VQTCMALASLGTLDLDMVSERELTLKTACRDPRWRNVFSSFPPCGLPVFSTFYSTDRATSSGAKPVSAGDLEAAFVETFDFVGIALFRGPLDLAGPDALTASLARPNFASGQSPLTAKKGMTTVRRR